MTNENQKSNAFESEAYKALDKKVLEYEEKINAMIKELDSIYPKGFYVIPGIEKDKIRLTSFISEELISSEPFQIE